MVEEHWRLMTQTKHVVRISLHRYQLKNIRVTAGSDHVTEFFVCTFRDHN
jgi:hypothetical protein